VIVLPHLAVKRLLDTGKIEIWTPKKTVRLCRCGARLSDAPRCPRCNYETAGEEIAAAPDLNVQHVVRKRTHGPAVAAAKGVFFRDAVLQELTYEEAVAAGFKTRDDFYALWRLKHGTGPTMQEPIECFVTTYVRVSTDTALHMVNPIAGRQGDYAANSAEAIDTLEPPTAEAWAKKAEKERGVLAFRSKQRWRRRARKAA